jgi:glycosyltransferase involved in cell wall biosynthesis
MPSARRIALVCPNYYPRTCGVGDHTMRLAQELSRRGITCAIFTRGPAEPNPEAPAVSVTGVLGATPLMVAHRLLRALTAFAPTDLILQYTPQMFDAWRLGSLATVWLASEARKRGIKVTVLAHELFLSWTTRPDLLVAAALMRLQFMALMKIAHHVLVTVDTRARALGDMARRFGLSGDVGVVRVGAGALPLPRTASSSGLRLGTFSTLGIGKRFDVVLDCFAAVVRERPGASLVLLGDLGSENEPRFRSLRDDIASHPAAGQIRVAGKQELAVIAQEVSALDLFLFPNDTGANTRSSTLPLALGAGLPVVAIKGRETDDLFIDGQNIIVAERLDGPAFAAAVLRVVGDPDLATRVARGAADLYRQQLSWDKIGDQLLAAM